MSDGRKLLRCDGKTASGDCASMHCFSCARVSRKPVGKWLCESCNIKRNATSFTPSQPDSKRLNTTIVSPDVKEKIRLALEKDRIPSLPGGDLTSSSPTSFGVSEAFSLVASKLDSIDSKLGNMVTSEQLLAVKSDILREFEKKIAEIRVAFENLERENVVLRGRVDELEKRIQSLASGNSLSSGISISDAAFRRISFIGFPLEDEAGRLKFVKQWMDTHFSGLTFSVGNIFRGAVRNRSLTSVVYVEFSDVDTRNLVLKKVNADAPVCSYSDKPIAIKAALSQRVRERIWALNSAYDLIKAHSAASGKVVLKTKGKDATVTVSGEVVFSQSGSTGLGSFSGVFSDLVLPKSK